jgi:hypothetical protein
MGPTKKFDAKPGETWRTAMGHRVKIIPGARADIIETAYVDGRVDGYLGINFDAASGTSAGGDALVEREA